MEDRENHNVIVMDLIVDEVWPFRDGSFPNFRPDFGPPLRMVCEVGQNVPDGRDEAQAKSLSASFIPVSGLIELRLGGTAEPNQ